MIAYIEKGGGLHAAVEAAGERLWQEHGGWYSSNDTVVQAIIDAYTPADQKAWALAQVVPAIKAERERRQVTGGFPVTLPDVGLVRFHSDAHSRSQHAGLYAAATLTLMEGGSAASPVMDPATGKQVMWRTMSGAMVPLSVGALLTLLQASMSHEGAIHAAADAHIAAATASADPLAYDYSTGWPE